MDIVWGIRGLEQSMSAQLDPFADSRGTPLFDSTFDLASAEAQELLLTFCGDFGAAHPELTHGVRRCFPWALRLWAATQGAGWPIAREDFDRVLKSFLDARPDFRRDVGWVPDAPAAKWARISLRTTFPEYSAAVLVRDQRRAWEGAVAGWVAGGANVTVSEDSALRGVRLTSEAIVWSQTQLLAVYGTVSALVTALAAAVIIVTLFTGCSLRLAFFVLIVLSSIIALVISALVALGWSIGVVEAIALTTLVGLAVDFSLHIAQAYAVAEPESYIDVGAEKDNVSARRVARAQLSTRSIAPAIVSAAMSTVLALVPMLWCHLRLCWIFSLITMGALLLSVLASLHFLVPMLMCFGPSKLDSHLLKALFGSLPRAFLTLSLIGGCVVFVAWAELRERAFDTLAL